MKTQRPILLGVIVLTIIIGFSLLNAQPGAIPLLAFTGYGRAATNTAQLANFELRNTTTRTIWLCYSGTEFPLRTPFLERPLAVQVLTNAALRTNVYSLSLGSFFMRGEKLLPGQNLLLEFPLVSGKPTSQVGIYYYVGRFKDGNDFLGNLGTPLLDRNATLKDKGSFYWEKSKRRFRAPKRYEVWCPQPVCFQASTSNTPPANRTEPMGVER